MLSLNYITESHVHTSSRPYLLVVTGDKVGKSSHKKTWKTSRPDDTVSHLSSPSIKTRGMTPVYEHFSYLTAQTRWVDLALASRACPLLLLLLLATNPAAGHHGYTRVAAGHHGYHLSHVTSNVNNFFLFVPGANATARSELTPYPLQQLYWTPNADGEMWGRRRRLLPACRGGENTSAAETWRAVPVRWAEQWERAPQCHSV